MNDRLDKYFVKYLDEFVFLELMPEYIKREHLDFMRNVPMPVRKHVIEALAADQGIEFKHFTLGMINIVGINPSFKFTPQYINFLRYVNNDIVRAIVLVGIEEAKEGELDRACISFRAALTISPDDTDALYNYVLVCRNLYEKGEDNDYVRDFKEEVLESLLRLQDLKPDFDMCHYYLGFACINSGQYLQAQKQWETFVRLSTRKEELAEIKGRLEELREPVLIERGYNAVISGDYETGLSILERFRDTSRMEWWPLPYYLGVGYNRAGRYEEALAMLKRALDGNPASGEIMAELVLVNNALGDEVNAEKYKKKLDIIRSRE